MKTISSDLSTFYNVYEDLSIFSNSALPLQYSSRMPYVEVPIAAANQRHDESYGAEPATTWKATSRSGLTGGYNRLRVETRFYPQSGH